jgi:hypothetical protein
MIHLHKNIPDCLMPLQDEILRRAIIETIYDKRWI